MIFAFDTETIDGEPYTIQFAGPDGAVLWLVSRDTILDVFVRFLMTHGDADGVNLLWAHYMEFDLGVVFMEMPSIWVLRLFSSSFELPDGTRVDVSLHLVDRPYGTITIGSRQWWLRDTMGFFNTSLEHACEQLRLPVRKLPRPDYLGQRAPTEEEWAAFEAYALNDARAAYELGRYIVERHRDFRIRPTISVAQMASVIFRQHFLPRSADAVGNVTHGTVRRRIHRAPSQGTRHMESSQESLTEDVEKVREIAVTAGTEPGLLTERMEPRIPFCETHPGSNAVVEASLRAYHGGKNGLYVPPGVYEGVTEVDIVSAYPHAMTALPPLTRGRWDAVTEYVRGAAGVYRVRGTVRGRCPYGLFLRTGSTEKIHNGAFDVWVTGWELDSALDEIDAEVLEGCVWLPASDAANPLAAYVEHFFRKKQELPKDNPRREMAKLLLNSLYGKFVQRTEDIDPRDGRTVLVAGSLFNPFWAAQITGHCRARLHRLEHTYQALHASTDSLLTRHPPEQISTGLGLGDLEVKAHGRLTVLRNKVYVIQDAQGRIVKRAFHGFRGSSDQLFDLVTSGRERYTVRHMVRPREALRTGQKPFRMVTREYRLRLPEDVRRHLAKTFGEHP